uniref:Myosin-IIIa-like n=1 Tax=Saccoglossus kowalevskii TaxID=10224 RepID=A0ABM0ME65_SACKO|nr:PREDICTED: myosin-IIIa-like [Saccoglossus kowalevskii]
MFGLNKIVGVIATASAGISELLLCEIFRRLDLCQLRKINDLLRFQDPKTTFKIRLNTLSCRLCTCVFLEGEEITVLKNVEQANDGRDALVKALYGRLFSWIVNQINDMLAPREGYRGETRCNIGILDIFGFENFKHNSFEQLCINVTNEQLQYYFNQSIFAWEQSEYANEGINMQEIQFQNNMKLLELFMARPIGILSLLDEESKFPQATDDTLVQKLNERCSRNSYYIAASGVYRGAIFGIRHYASQVVYNAAGFLEKNRDTLHQNIVDAMSDSDNSFIREIFSTNFKGSSAQHNVSSKDRKAILLCAKQPKLRPGGNEKQRTMSRKKTDPKQPMTVASYFKESLTDLMDKILSAEPQFIRCIKPNHTKQPNRFDREVVLNQLRCTGVLETTRIRRLGYAVRLSFADFLRSYKFLHFPLSANIAPNAVNCYQLIQSTGLTEWQVGKSKVDSWQILPRSNYNIMIRGVKCRFYHSQNNIRVMEIMKY